MNRYPTDLLYKKWLQSYHWRTLRFYQLAEHPWCEECLMAHQRVEATDVHHIQPVLSFPTYRERSFMMFNPHNLQSLCKACHDKKHNRKEQAQHQEERAQNKQQAFKEKYGR